MSKLCHVILLPLVEQSAASPKPATNTVSPRGFTILPSMPSTFSLATSLKNKLGGGSGRGGSPQPAGGSSPQPRVSFVDSADPNETLESTGKLPQRDMDAELRASPACQRKSAAGEHELEDDEQEPSLDSVFARRISTPATRAHPWQLYIGSSAPQGSTPL